MFQFKATDAGGHPIVGLGLSEANVELLRAGRPILVDLWPRFGLAMKLCICWGQTEQHLYDQFKQGGLIGPDTVEHRDDGPPHPTTGGR